MEVEIVQPVREGNLAPGGSNPNGTRSQPCYIPRPWRGHRRRFRSGCNAALTAGVAKPGADHELAAAVGANLRHFPCRSRERSLHRWFEHGRRPPKLLLCFLCYTSVLGMAEVAQEAQQEFWRSPTVLEPAVEAA